MARMIGLVGGFAKLEERLAANEDHINMGLGQISLLDENVTSLQSYLANILAKL